MGLITVRWYWGEYDVTTTAINEDRRGRLDALVQTMFLMSFDIRCPSESDPELLCGKTIVSGHLAAGPMAASKATSDSHGPLSCDTS